MDAFRQRETWRMTERVWGRMYWEERSYIRGDFNSGWMRWRDRKQRSPGNVGPLPLCKGKVPSSRICQGYQSQRGLPCISSRGPRSRLCCGISLWNIWWQSLQRDGEQRVKERSMKEHGVVRVVGVKGYSKGGVKVFRFQGAGVGGGSFYLTASCFGFRHDLKINSRKDFCSVNRPKWKYHSWASHSFCRCREPVLRVSFFLKKIVKINPSSRTEINNNMNTNTTFVTL